MSLQPADPQIFEGRCRIVVADDHELIREGIAAVLGREAEFVICGTTSSEEGAGKLLAQHRPNLLLIDLSISRDGLTLLRKVGSNFPATRVLVLAAYAEERYAERVLRSGARGYFLKSDSGAQLVEAIRTVAAGETYTHPRIASFARGRLEAAGGVGNLTILRR